MLVESFLFLAWISINGNFVEDLWNSSIALRLRGYNSISIYFLMHSIVLHMFRHVGTR